MALRKSPATRHTPSAILVTSGIGCSYVKASAGAGVSPVVGVMVL